MSIRAGRSLALAALITSLAACEAQRPPPALLMSGGLPISGSLAQARAAGFARCLPDTRTMRCQRAGVSFAGLGPFNAAVDLVGGDGAGGFDYLTLWHDTDQSALIKVADHLRSTGWSECLTPEGNRWEGQAIYQRQGAPIFVALDLSYWSKRRLTLYPAPAGAIPRCRPA